MAGPIFDPLNPNESPATKYQREIDAMNKRGGRRKKSKEDDDMSDAEFDKAYEQQRLNMPTYDRLVSNISGPNSDFVSESAGGRVGKGKKKKVIVKKRVNFLGRGAGAALRGF
jgi:hypothetical protein